MTWEKVPVGSISTQIRGVTYDKSDLSSGASDKYITLLRAGNIQDGELLLDDLVYVSRNKIVIRQILKAGDILIAASSGSLSMVGKAARVREDYDAAFGAFCKVLRPDTSRVDPNYFGHFFQTEAYRNIISALAQGANINNIRGEHLDNLEIPLPPLPIQRRIAAVLDEVDALRQKRERSIELIESIAHTKFSEMFGEPLQYSSESDNCRLGSDIFSLTSGKFYPKSEHVEEGNYPVYGGNGIMGTSDKYMLENSTLVIGRVGAYCGAVHLTEPMSWITDNAIYVKFKKIEYSDEFMLFQLRLLDLNRLADYSGQPKITQSTIDKQFFAVPEIELQQHFTNYYNRLRSEQQEMQNHLKHMNNLAASLQARAFSGALALRELTEV